MTVEFERREDALVMRVLTASGPNGTAILPSSIGRGERSLVTRKARNLAAALGVDATALIDAAQAQYPRTKAERLGAGVR